MFRTLIDAATGLSALALLLGVAHRLWWQRRRVPQPWPLAGWFERAEWLFIVAGSISLIVHFDFETFLFTATVAAGLVYALDAWLWASRRDGKAPLTVEYARSFFPVLLIVLLLRSFLVEPFRIPSGSMLPTLEIGDFVLTSKFSYGLRLPVWHTEILPIGEPERGDIVVFRYPENPRVNYIKRVIGVPGDRIAYRDKRLWVNGEPVPLEPKGWYVHPIRPVNARRYREALPGHPHDILLYPDRASIDVMEFEVPPGHYFVMGDNRDDSRDSRFWGFLPRENLVGKAIFIWMHWDFGGGGLNLGRIGPIPD
ncbi:MAG: signal peptidase I [Gammaproteobacteria bacterium]|nr:MAG: signal peptidase I [Gammaproteobacteria bacterium]